ncbi:MAG: ribosome small subunit-dependent GTPase A [Bacteroidetes bacterium]|nr:ribosome small subunit-dependent GTPase A [Bacteroidota bacterium]
MRGIVIKSTGSWYTVLTENGAKIECRLKGKFRIEGMKATNPIAVGDSVEIKKEPDLDVAIIDTIHERKNYIIRKSTNLSKQTHIIAANIDQAFVMATLAMPRTSTGFIDRFLLTAEAYAIPANIIFNKIDLYDEAGMSELQTLKNIYEKIGYKCYFTSTTNMHGIAELKDVMKGKTNLIAGHSGVGKSSLINCLDTSLHLKTGNLSEAHDKGMHTTTFAEMFILDHNTFLIDTPGIKEFGVVDLEKNQLSHYFPEIFRTSNNCKFNSCLHVNEPGCAVTKAIEQGEIALFRYSTYLSILSGDELKKEYEQ